MIVRAGMGDVVQGSAAIAALNQAAQPWRDSTGQTPEDWGFFPDQSPSTTPKDSSGLPVGAAAGATSVIEVAAVAAMALAVLLALRLFR